MFFQSCECKSREDIINQRNISSDKIYIVKNFYITNQNRLDKFDSCITFEYLVDLDFDSREIVKEEISINEDKASLLITMSGTDENILLSNGKEIVLKNMYLIWLWVVELL